MPQVYQAFSKKEIERKVKISRIKLERMGIIQNKQPTPQHRGLADSYQDYQLFTHNDQIKAPLNKSLSVICHFKLRFSIL